MAQCWLHQESGVNRHRIQPEAPPLRPAELDVS